MKAPLLDMLVDPASGEPSKRDALVDPDPCVRDVRERQAEPCG